jgi:hypothetical protein
MRSRTPPLTEPNGWEKSTVDIRVICTPTEKLLWKAVFGVGQVSEVARSLLNEEAHFRANIPKPAVER